MKKRAISNEHGGMKVSSRLGPTSHPDGNGAEFGHTGNYSPLGDVSWKEYLGSTLQVAGRENDKLMMEFSKLHDTVDPVNTTTPSGLYLVFPRSLTDSLSTIVALKRQLHRTQLNLDASRELMERIRLNERDPSKPGSIEWDGLHPESSDNRLIGVGIGQVMSSGFPCQRFMSVWRVGPETLKLCCGKHRTRIVEAQGLATFTGHDCECGHCPGDTMLPGEQDGAWFKQLNRYMLETEIDAEREEATTKRARIDTGSGAAETPNPVATSCTTTLAGAASTTESVESAWAPVTEPTESQYNPLISSGSDEDEEGAE